MLPERLEDAQTTLVVARLFTRTKALEAKRR